MSIAIMSWVWKTSKSKGTALNVELALADFANDDGECWPAIETIAKKSRCSVRSAQTVIRTLEKQHRMEIVENGGPHGVNKYRFLQEAPQAVLPGVASRGVQNLHPSSEGATPTASGVQPATAGVQPTASGVQDAPRVVQIAASRGAKHDPYFAPKPSGTVRDPSTEPPTDPPTIPRDRARDVREHEGADEATPQAPVTAAAVWDGVLEGLQQRVTAQNFDTWLRRSKGLRIDAAGALVVEVPNGLAADWVSTRMSSVISKGLAIYEITDFRCEVAADKQAAAAAKEPSAARR